MSHDKDTIDYFDLIVQVARVVGESCPEHLSMRGYTRKRIQDAWHRVNSNLAAGGTGPGLLMTAQNRRDMAKILGELAREALIAAELLCVGAGDRDDYPEFLTETMTKAEVESQVKI